MCTCASVGAATIFGYGDWSLVSAGSAGNIAFAVRSYDGSDEIVTVPNDYGGYPIAAIGAYAFATNEALRELTIDRNVTKIGDGAFMQCSALTKIEIPDSVTEIGEDAFYGCGKLVIYGTAESYAIEYAKAHDIDYVRTNVVTYVLGDADGDGAVRIFDVTVIQRHLIGMSVPDPATAERNGDVNFDGLDMTDATKIQRHLIKMPTAEPIGTPVEAVLS